MIKNERLLKDNITNSDLIDIVEEMKIEIGRKIYKTTPLYRSISLFEENERLYLSYFNYETSEFDSNYRLEIGFDFNKKVFYIKNKYFSLKATSYRKMALFYFLHTINVGFTPYTKDFNLLYPYLKFTSYQIDGIFLLAKPDYNNYYFKDGVLVKEFNKYIIDIIIEESILVDRKQNKLNYDDFLTKMTEILYRNLRFLSKPKNFDDAPDQKIGFNFSLNLNNFLESLK